MSIRSPEPMACEEATEWLAGLAGCSDPLAYAVQTLTTPVRTDHRQAARAVAAAAWLADRPTDTLDRAGADTRALVAHVLREVLALPAWERRWPRPSEREAARRAVHEILQRVQPSAGPDGSSSGRT